MTYTPPPELDPPQRICEILSHMREALQQSITEIERIAARQVLRHGDDTLEGLAWCDFGDGLRGDVARAARAIQWEIAALRGELVYRGLLSSPQSTASGDQDRPIRPSGQSPSPIQRDER